MFYTRATIAFTRLCMGYDPATTTTTNTQSYNNNDNNPPVACSPGNTMPRSPA